MRDILVITKLYELIALLGKDTVYKMLCEALQEAREAITEDHVKGDIYDQKRTDL